MRQVDGLLAMVVVLLLAAGAVYLAEVETVVGRVRIVDGDSLVLDGRSIRLAGMDAPELGQTCARGEVVVRCGERARERLQALTAGREVSCRVTGRDRYRRDLARCTAGSEDLAARLVREGVAVAFGAFEAEEGDARRAGRGLWLETFDRPVAWRRQHRREAGG